MQDKLSKFLFKHRIMHTLVNFTNKSSSETKAKHTTSGGGTGPADPAAAGPMIHSKTYHRNKNYHKPYEF